MDFDDEAVILIALAEACGWPYRIVMTEWAVVVEWV